MKQCAAAKKNPRQEQEQVNKVAPRMVVTTTTSGSGPFVTDLWCEVERFDGMPYAMQYSHDTLKKLHQ